MEGKSHWHFATHGFYYPDDIWRSGIVVVEKYATMTIRSILQNYNGEEPRLVVLSACETGISGSFIDDTEFGGLPGAFISKGAAGVISSLWPVDDRATALLMGKFYDLHMDEGQDPATALRGAQNWLREATPDGIIAYITQAKDDGRIDETAASKFNDSVSKGRSDNPLFAQSWDITHRVGSDATPSPSKDHPFQHPYYWAGFYYSGY